MSNEAVTYLQERFDIEILPTTNQKILDWVLEISSITKPDKIHWVSGSETEKTQLLEELVAKGTLRKLNHKKYPNSYLATSDINDVARVESRTFICSEQESDAGFTNNWVDPKDMKKEMLQHYAGSMRGRTMYIIPFVMGSMEVESPKFGLQITDSAYVVTSMRIMCHIGKEILDMLTEKPEMSFVAALHSVGAPLKEGEADSSWPCNSEKYITHFPEEKAIWSYGSGYGGNALLGKKSYALRIASKMAQEEGWLAEHMLIIKISSPHNTVHYIAAAFPSACGKTNLAMLESELPGWKIETLGDDIAWLSFDNEGQLRATNPETGFFGVAPGTSRKTNPNAMKAIAAGNTIFTNIAYTEDGDIWWEGMNKTPPESLLNWRGQHWDAASDIPASHPNSRFCTPIDQCPTLAKEYYDPRGVPISAILFGGRRKDTMPLVAESYSWEHGVFLGATVSSETTAAAEGKSGQIRRDPMAMLPFIGYNAGDYLQHWLNLQNSSVGDVSRALPKIFYVNWFRKNSEENFLWPGFGENIRVLKWIVERLEGSTLGVDTPAGCIPEESSFDLSNLDISSDIFGELFAANRDEWVAELADIKLWLQKFGDSLPKEMVEQLNLLEKRVSIL